MTKQTSLRGQKGFTLIEVMIVVAIVGILAAVAYPSYKESIAKSRRADGVRALMEADQFMKRYYSAKDTYEGATLPAALKTAPKEGAETYSVTLSLDKDDYTTYSLKLARSGAMAEDRCGDLTITQTGQKTQSGNDSSATMADCFKGI